ncbi:MAG: MBL fold metallo-hydrolase [Candidatus Promineifilaceae bacterium]|nr:MBL fold metallo-hydrolase [Candidatus Promineifilaceae bacterium]
MEIRPDVHLIQGRASNFYLCTGSDELTLIDTGMPNEQQLLFGLLDQLGHHHQQLSRIIITHADIDHAGSLAAIQSATGAAVYAGEQTAHYLQKGTTPPHLPRLVQWFTNAFLKYQPVGADCLKILRDGDQLPVLNGLLVAIATPGHTDEHFSFYSAADGILFAGDALSTRNGRLQRTPRWITDDEEAANQSAIHLIQLAPATIACGHGDPMSDHEMGDLMRFFNQLRENGK